MSKKQIDAILWRSYLAATSSALWGLNKSQYYFELPSLSPDYLDFLGDKVIKNIDPQGNQSFVIELEPFLGSPPVDRYELKLTKLREDVRRAGNWQVLNQREGQAYPLWAAKRGPLRPFQDSDELDKKRNFILIARDVDGRFHGRWIRGEDFIVLPPRIQELLMTKDVGWSNL